MGIPSTTNGKLDLIIDSIQEIKEMRKDVITLVEWKNSVNERLEDLEEKPHECLKTGDISSLKTTISSINKFKWWFLGVLIMITSTVISFSMNLSNDFVESKSNIITNKENIHKLDRRIEKLDEYKHGSE